MTWHLDIPMLLVIVTTSTRCDPVPARLRDQVIIISRERERGSHQPSSYELFHGRLNAYLVMHNSALKYIETSKRCRLDV
jgi:hypothetical protein